MGRMVYEFQDTQRQLIEKEKLYRLTSNAIMCTALYPEHLSVTRVMGSCYTNISVAETTTLRAAERLSQQYPKIAVLNFANAVTPGGGAAYGEESQEAGLCRCTNLYPCLTKNENFIHFYQYNDGLAPYYSSRIIYSENITVIKRENGRPLERYFPVDVITCAAPNVRDQRAKLKKKKLKKLLEERIRNILMAAELHGVQALVLGAFGCGTFGNSPDMVAEIFQKLLVQGEFAYSFREVVFAIAVNGSRDQRNLQAFREQFGSMADTPLWGKKLSVYGDSISTYMGYNPQPCKVYYDRERAGRAGIFSADSTWWAVVLKHFGAQLLMNNSWSGSKVYGDDMSAGSSEWRTRNLHRDGELPDIILIYMGVNDYGYGIYPGEGYFQSAYERMLWTLKGRYPRAKIYCATLACGAMNGQKTFPAYLNGNAFEDYNQAIRIAAQKYRCRLVDLAAMGITYESVDGTHPNAMGMQQLAEGWIRGIEEAGKKKTTQKKKKRSWPQILVPVLLGIEAVIIIVLIMLIFNFVGKM